MSEAPDWLPPLIELGSFGGDPTAWLEAVYDGFFQDFIESQPCLNGLWVRVRRDPMFDGKEAGFWHCVQEGHVEDERVPDPRRCERIRWVRAVIEHHGDSRVSTWMSTRQGEPRLLLWCDEAFLIVLGQRTRKRDGAQYLQLITAYCTERESRRQSLRKERDEAQKRLAPP